MSTERVIVSIRRDDEQMEVDLELPAGLQVQRVCELVCQELGWVGQEFQVEALPGKRTLDLADSLENQDVWDGAWLVFHAITHVDPPQPSKATVEAPKGPIGSVNGMGWTPIQNPFADLLPDQDAPPETKKDQQPPASSPWKKIG